MLRAQERGALGYFRDFAGPVEAVAIDAWLVRRWLAALAEQGLTGTSQHTYSTRLKTFVTLVRE